MPSSEIVCRVSRKNNNWAMLLRDESTKDNTEGPDFIKDVRDNKITGKF